MTLAATVMRPRPVFCVVAGNHRNLGVAEDVARGRFTLAGETRALGLDPDWRSPCLPADEEWRIEWSKFAYGLDLANAYVASGDDRYLAAWERLVGSWIESVPADWDSSEVAARRIQYWIYAWSAFASAAYFGGLRAGLEDRLLASIAEQAAFVRANLTAERNHRTLELYGLLIAGLALPELDAGGTLTAFALAELADNLVTDFRADGTHREGSSHYHAIVLRSFLGLAENARRFDLELPPGFEAALGRACDVLLHLHRPDGRIAALSDGDTDSYRDLLLLAGDLLDRPDMTYVATAGASGRAPECLAGHFPAGGIYTQRSGFGEGGAFADARFLVFDCGPLGDGGHGHYDALAIEAFGRGRPLVVDPGRYTYAEGEPNLRHWFKGTAAHNTVCIDATDQTPYRRGKPKGPVAEARLLDRFRSAGVDMLRGTVESPCYEAVHERRVVFVAGEYWLVEDRLRSRASHRYDLRFHLSDEAEGRTAIAGSVVTAPGLALVVADGGIPVLEPGWIAPAYGVRLPAPVVSVVAAGTGDWTFLTLIAPLADGDAPPSVEADITSDGSVVRVDGTNRDTIVWSGGWARLERSTR
jgi:hypothetical protein